MLLWSIIFTIVDNCTILSKRQKLNWTILNSWVGIKFEMQHPNDILIFGVILV